MLTLRLFGMPTFQLDHQPLAAQLTGRAAALLVYLAVTRQPQPRTALADLLWENTTEAQARTNLRYLLSGLRKVVGEYVVAQGENVAFNQALPYWVDVTAFTTCMSSTAHPVLTNIEPELLQELLNLYTGEFLAGFQTEGTPIFDRWLLSQRRHLHDLHVQALRLRTQQHLNQGEYAEGLAINHYLLTLEPWREEAHQQRMLLLAHSGQRSAALQQYARCCATLAEELEVPPMPQTTALYEQIKSGHWFATQTPSDYRPPMPVAVSAFPSAELSVRHNGATVRSAPAPKPLRYDLGAMPDAAHFYGRQAELATLHSWLGQAQSRLIALLGGCGQGKTALAAALVQEISEDEEHRMYGFTQVIWRSLHGAPTCVETLQSWLQQLDPGQTDLRTCSFDELVTRLFTILQSRRCLLVLDGVEALLTNSTDPAEEVVERYRPGCEAYGTLFQLFFQRRQRSCLLLTSRVRPAALSALDERNGAFHTLAVSGLPQADGAELLATLRIAGDPALRQQLHHCYAGNPLLLIQAANLIHELFGGDAAAFLQEGICFLGDIGAALTQQLAQLTPLEQQVVQRLAQVGRPCHRQALYTDLAPFPTKAAYFQALQHLQRASLVQATDDQVELPALLMAYLAEHTLVAQ